MTVREILSRKGGDVFFIGTDATIHDALRMLNARRIGALIVTGGDGTIAGIVSERDLLRECGERCATAGDGSLAAFGNVPVRAVMTRDVITATQDDALTTVMNVMTENRIRHLPIVEDGTLVGIISIGDAVKACVEIAEAENRVLKEYIQGAY